MNKICFLDFWEGFNPNNNFILYILRSIMDVSIVANPNDSDIIIYSCFGYDNTRYNKKKIFFTGENKRPEDYQCDVSISFDLDNNKNVRIPLWYYYIDWFNVGSYVNPSYLIPLDDLYKKYNDNRPKFCAAIYSANHLNRSTMVNYLNTYKEVDCYGKIHKYNIPDGEDVKLNILQSYKFSLCMENSISVGYYTEKLLHAKVAGTIPIYYSDNNISMDFNDRCFINTYNKTYTEVLEIVKEIDNNEKLYLEMREQPLFNKTVDISVICNKLKVALVKNGFDIL